MDTPSIYPEDFKRYVGNLGGRLKSEIFHGEYQQKIRFSEVPSPTDKVDSGSGCFAEIHMDCTYLWFRITVYPSILDYWNIGDFRDLFLHPVTEIFMWDVPASQVKSARDTIERQTQRIANTVDDLLGKDWWLPEKINSKIRQIPVPEVETYD